MSSIQSPEFDVAVIGGGSAGYAAARATAAAGLSTVVVEGGTEVGGLCILRGCMPTKTLLASAEVLHLARQAPEFGVYPERIRADWKAVMARKRRLIGEFADYRRNQLEHGAFRFIRATASFVDPHRMILSDGNTLTAKHFVLSTGSKVGPCPIPSLEKIGCLSSDDALEMERLPESMIVLGGGAVAVEFAQLFARFGVRVTLVQRSEHILREMDPEAAEVIEAVFRREGIKVYTSTRLLGARHEGGLKTIEFEHEGQLAQVQAEEVLFGLGRVPNTTQLNLEAAGVRSKQGRIVTNSEMRTSAPHIFAAGDCTGLYEIVHLAVQQGEIAGHNLAHPASIRHMDYRLLSTVVFTDPQTASVGLTEKAARGVGINYRTASYPFADHGKSMILDAKDGFVKLLADPVTGEILGGAVVGPMGGELIHEIMVAMALGGTVHELAAMPHYHPTLAEIWTYPAEELAEKIPLPRAAREPRAM